MMLLAQISWVGLLVVVLLGWLVIRWVNRRDGQRRGMGWKVLGVAAMVAGVAVLWTRAERHRGVDVNHQIEVNFDEGFPFSGDFSRPFRVERHVENAGFPRWMLISLGSGLVILGVLLFGRERTRPAAFKLATLVGIGAIVFAVVSFVRDRPRGDTESARVVRLAPVVERYENENSVQKRVAKRPSRARRPALRPRRPLDQLVEERIEKRISDELPPRAGEIPVSVEIAQASATPAPVAAPAAQSPVTEPSAPAPVAAAAEPAPAAADQPATEKPAPEKEDAPAAATPAAATPAPATPAPTAPAPAAAPQSPAEPSAAPPPADLPAASEPGEAAPATDDAIAPQARPQWVDAPASLAGQVYALPIKSGLFASVPECQRELDREIKRVADHYIDEYLGDLGERPSQLVSIPLAYLKQHVKKAEYAEVVHPQSLPASLGPMYQLHARLEFDDQARSDFRRLWNNAAVADRLWYTGGAAALMLALLATFYGYLRLDMRTDSTHKGKLQLAATLVALIAAAGVLLVRWAVPF